MQNIPLAERIRPRKLSQVIGQKHLIGENGILKKAINIFYEESHFPFMEIQNSKLKL